MANGVPKVWIARLRAATGVLQASTPTPPRPLIGVHRLGSLCAGRLRFFVALTPSPSPTLWERGAARQRFWSAEASASASGGSSASALHIPLSHIPLSRLAGGGDTGGEGKRACLPCCNCAQKNRACFRDYVPDGCTLTRGVGVGCFSFNPSEVG